MDLDSYFARIGYGGGREPTLENLRAMHRAHAYTVPFENLDIANGTRIQVDEDVNLDKIVRRRRGGFCLELTGTFARVLRQLGYTVDVISGRVFADGRLGRPMSHMTLIVDLDEPWIADVGFGGRIIEPLRLLTESEQQVGQRSYTVANDGDHFLVTAYEPGQGGFGARNQDATYLFTRTPREFHEFQDACDWLQTSPESRFTHGSIVSLPRPDGRVTLAGGRLITLHHGERTEVEVPPSEEPAILEREFGIVPA
jgi:N-hydroxyarylamine O-acetyltransferase